MKNIYVIFSSTDLKIGKMIRFVTKNDYNHCSICLNSDFSMFYSFSRLYFHNPLICGFTVESPCRYTLSQRTKVKIVTVPLSDSAYFAVEKMINTMNDHCDEYVYNFFSALSYLFGVRFNRSKAFTCAEFTNNVLKTAGLDMPKMANIEQMEQALSGYPTWEGRAVDGFDDPSWGDDPYLDHVGKMRSAVQIARRIMLLMLGPA